jgi:cbb3-type cytochrome oxidase subunit 1
MEWFVKAFIKASLTWLVLGVSLGVAMAAHPLWIVYRPAHLHMVLLGFVTMMIFGVAYHVIPRFAGHPLHSRRAAAAHWFISNAGLAGMAAGFILRANGSTAGTPALVAGGVLAAAGAYTFAYVLWRTLDGPSGIRQASRRAAAAAAKPGLPVAGAGRTR